METTQSVLTEIELGIHDAAEYRRVLAWKLFCQGNRQKDIAQLLDVTQGAVSQWMKRAKQHGVQALRKRTAPGRQPYLTAEQKAQLPALLEKGAEHFEFRGDYWTRARVAEVIRREYNVSFCDAHISRLLKAIGWSHQKPVPKAAQRDEAKIALWKKETLPALKKRRGRRGALSYIEMKAVFIFCPP